MKSARIRGLTAGALLQLTAVSASADDATKETTNDMAVAVIERLNKKTEAHQSMMKSDACEAVVRRHDAEGDFLETLNFPDAKVHGLVKGWVCIKPDGSVVRSKSISREKP